MTNSTRTRVALLLGGDSAERPVSFLSGRAMAGALSPERFQVTIFDVCLPATRAREEGANPLGTRARHALVPVDWNHLIATLYTGGFEVALPALHSGRGEDGTLQALLEVAGIRYVGSPMSASVLAMDKQACKAILRDLEIPVPRGLKIDDAAHLEAALKRGHMLLQGSCVVKPNDSGSSFGVTIFRQAPDEDELRRAVEAASTEGAALIEELLEGVEVTAAVLGEGEGARVLPLLEIVPQSQAGFYDYEAKYAPGGSQHLIPPRLSEEVQERVAEYALRAHRTLNCRGVARSDFIVTSDGTPYFLEINTLPGMTETSLVPDAARAAGISFQELLEGLIDDALKRAS